MTSSDENATDYCRVRICVILAKSALLIKVFFILPVDSSLEERIFVVTLVSRCVKEL